MNNLFAQSRSHWGRYDRYELKTAADGKRYITAEKTAKPDVYNPLKKSSEIVLEALNAGMLMMFSFMLVDEAKPLRLCKHCQKVFLGSRANSAFCSARCKNQYNVYKTRAKSREDKGNG